MILYLISSRNYGVFFMFSQNPILFRLLKYIYLIMNIGSWLIQDHTDMFIWQYIRIGHIAANNRDFFLRNIRDCFFLNVLCLEVFYGSSTTKFALLCHCIHRMFYNRHKFLCLPYRVHFDGKKQRYLLLYTWIELKGIQI